jgi:ABC-type Na+ transport system ATPase subunit NatA
MGSKENGRLSDAEFRVVTGADVADDNEDMLANLIRLHRAELKADISGLHMRFDVQEKRFDRIDDYLAGQTLLAQRLTLIEALLKKTRPAVKRRKRTRK